MPVDVQIAAVAHLAPAPAELARWAQMAMQDAPGSLCVRVVDAEEGRMLNDRYRGIDAPTNVLSFPAGAALPGEPHLGDVVVCAPVVEQQARQQQKAPAHHYAHMVVHGVLHLRGFDHQTDAQALAMERLESAILAAAGIADPYAA